MVNIKMELERILDKVDGSIGNIEDTFCANDILQDVYGEIEELITDIDLGNFEECGVRDNVKEGYCGTVLEGAGYIIEGDKIFAPFGYEDREDMSQCLDYFESVGCKIIWND
tara:strand:+ start:137 stop:472 length:336 start_codon:yes stop_codon:yes gene_type:complete